MAAAVVYSTLLRSCVTLRAASQIHSQIITSPSLLPHVTLQTDLLLLYSRSSSIDVVSKLFDDMCYKNMHTWNIFISAHVQKSLYRDALVVFFLRFLPTATGLSPDHYTLPSLLKACSALGYLSTGMVLHRISIQLGLIGHVVVAGSALDFYCICGSIHDACKLFDEMGIKDGVAWNSMISGFLRVGLFTRALDVYRKMYDGRNCELSMDARIVPTILAACGRRGELRLGREIHAKVLRKFLFNSDMVIGNSLIDMYSKSGSLGDSHRVFAAMENRNLITWTTLISSYGIHGMGMMALRLYDEMKATNDKSLQPNDVTFTSLLASCSQSGLVDRGMQLFKSIPNPKQEHYSCMVDLLGRSGRLTEALDLIKRMPEEASGSAWGALLGASVVSKNVETGEMAAKMLFDTEPTNPSNYVAMANIYHGCGMKEDAARLRMEMRGLGLDKIPGCSWISFKNKIYSFVQGGFQLSQQHDHMLDLLSVMTDKKPSQ
ncbi:Pentatricopeptide repeat protein 78 [Zostera marina]|uniref:Pentatricopeptide repeat protein 78 n=1 Tax=Zostera marina TaxID=29655 RepID=A0A0K9PM50_ZOSMR|nr:Pentatricopeptide repeat protein 78 [Zostera marina]